MMIQIIILLQTYIYKIMQIKSQIERIQSNDEGELVQRQRIKQFFAVRFPLGIRNNLFENLKTLHQNILFTIRPNINNQQIINLRNSYNILMNSAFEKNRSLFLYGRINELMETEVESLIECALFAEQGESQSIEEIQNRVGNFPTFVIQIGNVYQQARMVDQEMAQLEQEFMRSDYEMYPTEQHKMISKKKEYNQIKKYVWNLIVLSQVMSNDSSFVRIKLQYNIGLVNNLVREARAIRFA